MKRGRRHKTFFRLLILRGSTAHFLYHRWGKERGKDGRAVVPRASFFRYLQASSRRFACNIGKLGRALPYGPVQKSRRVQRKARSSLLFLMPLYLCRRPGLLQSYGEFKLCPIFKIYQKFLSPLSFFQLLSYNYGGSHFFNGNRNLPRPDFYFWLYPDQSIYRPNFTND